MSNWTNESILVSRLEELYLQKNYLQPPELIERFEEIIYSRYEMEEEIDMVNEILEWYEEEYDEEHRREEKENDKIHSFLTALVCKLDEGYSSGEEEQI